MSSQNSDLIDEENTNIHFLKESNSFSSSIFQLPRKCSNCEIDLSDTFILCDTCNAHICKTCFANGVEFGSHQSDHNYKILKSDFPLFDNTDWTAKEETILLDGILSHNNWHLISKTLPNRSVKEIKEHYNKYYIEKSEPFSGIKLNDDVNAEPIIPYRFQLNNVLDPFRNTENAPAGYNSARSDFEMEYDKGEEAILSNLETLDVNDEFYGVLSELQASIVSSYRRKLLERQRYKRVIREHGLIMTQKTSSWLHRYNSTLTPPVYEKLVRFMQFYTGRGFEYMMEGLHRAGELKIQIARLCEYRSRGIKTLDEAKLYLQLKNHREECLKEQKHFQHISELNIKYKSIPMPISICGSKRRSMTPLEIIGMPGYDRLTVNERELCSNIRLPPLNYMELKSILIAENNNMGFLRLLTARRLLKIDVNKTRKLYDFLIKEGFIDKPKDAKKA